MEKDNESKVDKRALVISIITGFIISSCLIIGYAADTWGELRIGNPWWWAAGAFIWINAAWLLYVLFSYMARITSDRSDRKPDNIKPYNVKTFITSWIIILICWIPVFLAEYPGFFVYDATDEYVEVATRTFTTHHPLLHVLLLGGSVCAGNKLFGDVNLGIAMYTIAQMFVLAVVFAWIIQRMKHKFIWTIWYGLFPTIVMFALCSAKDGLFGAALSAAVVLTKRVLDADHKDGGTIVKGNYICLAISLIFMMLLRHNGVYGFLIYAVATILYVAFTEAKNKKRILSIVLLMLIALGTYKLADVGLEVATSAQNTENQEILTVPIQQLARTYAVYRDEMPEEDINTLMEIIPEEWLTHYTPDLSDPVKAGFVNEAYKANPGKYQRLWWKLFREHPLSFINAWINTSYGFYYPGTIVNVYAGHEVHTFTYTESSYFGYEVEEPGVRISLIPAIDRFYRWLSLDDDIQKAPVVSLLFSMGVMFIVMLICLAYGLYSKNYTYVVSMTLALGVWLTLLLGPTFLPRYVVFLWFLLPWMIEELR